VALAGGSNTTAAGRARPDAVNLLRGVVMLVMALDHARDLFTGARFAPGYGFGLPLACPHWPVVVPALYATCPGSRE
jgi:uncharacterized membrane protein